MPVAGQCGGIRAQAEMDAQFGPIKQIGKSSTRTIVDRVGWSQEKDGGVGIDVLFKLLNRPVALPSRLVNHQRPPISTDLFVDGDDNALQFLAVTTSGQNHGLALTRPEIIHATPDPLVKGLRVS
jgi:hypothetical protein